jgi:hypothetical protein
VVVAGGKGECHEFDGKEFLGAAQDAEDELVELRGRGEQEAAVDGPGGDLHEAASLRQVA